MFKRIYLEITNNCNLNCKFCIKNSRPQKFITISEFEDTLKKIENYTNYLYFHVLGEPLLHPDINKLINIASEKFKINITTNGYLIKKVKDNKNIRQINISLHSFDEKYHIELEKYLGNIFEVADNLKENTIICYRLWVNSKYSNNIIEALNKKYNVNIENKREKLEHNVFFEVENEFIWPSLENKYFSEKGTCKGTIDHIGILCDGTVVPCCLDTKGIINLGNIHDSLLEEIINSENFKIINKGFKENKKIHPLCQKCSFYMSRKDR